MSSVKFVHVLKRIEALDRDINEIHALQSGINNDRSYATPLKISLEQQVNNLLNERTKLMEVRIQNAPEHLDPTKREIPELTKGAEKGTHYSFELFERDYYKNLELKRKGYRPEERKPLKPSFSPEESAATSKEPPPAPVPTKPREIEPPVKRPTPSLAEKSLEEGKEGSSSFMKKRTDLLKDLPPLEY